MEQQGKVCSKCGAWKPLEEFGNDKHTKDGKCSNCKECRKRYRENNKQKISEYHKEYKKKNKEKIKEYNEKNLIIKKIPDETLWVYEFNLNNMQNTKLPVTNDLDPIRNGNNYDSSKT